jgi:O-antigen/teichoic acid export membrane protein
MALLVVGTLAYALVVAGSLFLQGCSRFRAYTAVVAGAPWLYAGLLGGVWATAGLTVDRAIVVWVVAQAVPGALLCAVAVRAIGLGRPDAGLLAETVPFGLRAWLGGLAHFLNARIDQVILGLLAAEQALGVYAVAVNASEILFYLPAAVATAMLPAVAAADVGLQVERTLRAFRCVAVVTVAGAVAAAALGPLLVPVVFGDAYRAAVGPFLWLLASAPGYAACAVFSSGLLASSSPSLSSLGPAVALVVTVALDLLLIPAHGATGAAAAASGALLAGGAAAAVAFRRRAGLPLRRLVPGRADLAVLRGAAGRALPRPAGAQSPARRARRRAGASPS